MILREIVCTIFYRGIHFFALIECLHSPPLTTITQFFFHCIPPSGWVSNPGGSMVCAMPYHLLFYLVTVRLLSLRASGHVSSGRPCCSRAGLDVTGLERWRVGIHIPGGSSTPCPHPWHIRCYVTVMAKGHHSLPP